jgi:hypothetical protein
MPQGGKIAMLPSINTVVTERWHFWHTAITALTAGGAWETARRWLVRIVRAMPPLPANANFWERWLYTIMQGITDTQAGQAAPPAPTDAKKS